MKEYIDMVHRLIELPRNELRREVLDTKDGKLKKILDNYEETYYKCCLKIEEYIDIERRNMGLSKND